MEALLESPSGAPDRWVRHHVRQWLDRCVEFRKWERENLLLEEPGPELLAHHRKVARYMISTTRLMLSAISDPEFMDRSLRESVEGVLFQLEETWEMLHNPISHHEAEDLLARVFPE